MAECDKEGQPDQNSRSLTRIMVDTTHTRYMLQLGHNVPVNVFPSAKVFEGEKIDPTKNRHIIRVMFQGVPLIAELVKYFEEKYHT